MSMAYDPSNRDYNVEYMVKTTGDRWFIPYSGKGDNPDSGTTAQQLAACKALVGKQKTDNTKEVGEEEVVS